MDAKKTTRYTGMCFQRTGDGTPTIIIHRRCKILIEALGGGWHYPTQNNRGTAEDDGYYIHLGDAFRYLTVNVMKPRDLIHGADKNASRPRGIIERDPSTGQIVSKSRSLGFDGDRPLEPEFMNYGNTKN